MTRWKTAWGAVAAVGLVAGCGRSTPYNEEAGEAGVRAVVSIQPQEWLIRRIGGEHVTVQTLVRPGNSPATYQPTDIEISRVMAADVYFRIGVPFERASWSESIRSAPELRVVNTRQNVPLRDMEQPSGHAAHHGDQPHTHSEHQDPHVWLSPPLLKIQAKTIAAHLRELDPAHAETYQQNLDSLERKLDQADETIRQKLAPFQGKAFLIFHPAWGYFADEYELRQVAIQSQGKEPTDQEMTALQSLVREEGISVIFVQPQISGDSAEAIAEAIGGRVETLNPLAEDILAEILRAAEVIAKSYEPDRSQPVNLKAST